MAVRLFRDADEKWSQAKILLVGLRYLVSLSSVGGPVIAYCKNSTAPV